MECAGNTLVVHVVSVRGLTIKGGKPVDVYCSLSTSGKGPWKSKVSTNAIRAEPSSTGGVMELRWDERCEFQLNDADTKLVLHINHKTIFGTTETLGELIFQLEQMPRLQSPTWFRLGKPGSADKERGQIQLGFQFSNTLGHRGVTSISNLSLNKIEKENKLHRLRRKMQEFGRKATGTGDGSTADTQSLASISIAAGRHHQNLTISRRSSISSTNSGALAFSSPSPNPPILDEDADEGHHDRFLTLIESEVTGKNLNSTTPEAIGYSARRGGKAANWANSGANNQQNAASLFISTSSETPSSFDTGSSHQKQPSSYATFGQENVNHQQQNSDLLRPPSSNAFERRSSSHQQPPQHVADGGFDDGNNSLGRHSNISGRSAFSVFSSSMTTRDGIDKANEQHQKTPPPPSSQQKLRVKMRQKAEQLLQLRALTGGGNSSTKKQTAEQCEMDRRDSIASSSGFVSFGSGQLGALNEQTSPEHLLNVIRHLRRELLKKEERIRDLEEYTDHLVTKVMVTNPELLAAPSPNKPGERRQKIHQRPK